MSERHFRRLRDRHEQEGAEGLMAQERRASTFSGPGRDDRRAGPVLRLRHRFCAFDTDRGSHYSGQSPAMP